MSISEILKPWLATDGPAGWQIGLHLLDQT